MDGVQHSFHDLGYTPSRMRVSLSLMSARSNCAVSGFVIRIVLCSATPYRNQRAERLMFRRQHKKKLGWNNTSVQPITIASLLGVDMWALANIRIRSDHRDVLTLALRSCSAARYVLKVWFQLQPSTGFIRCEIRTNVKHVLHAPPSRHQSSVVSR